MTHSTITIDPLGKFSQTSEKSIIEACGIIPYWIVNGDHDKKIMDIFREKYSFGIHEMTGATILNNGTYLYPEDPPLYPLIRLHRGGEVMFQYDHAIVAVTRPDTGETFITRMD